MTHDLITALAIFAFVTSITPGPNNLMLMASGMNFGLYRTIPHMLGVGLGFVVMVFLVGLGLARIFELYPVSYQALKVASVVYLVYLAWKIATAAPASLRDQTGNGAKPISFLQAALFQWVNPKAWAMALTAVSAYTPPSQPLSSILVVALVFGMINLPAVSSWTILGMQLRRILKQPAKLRAFNILCAVLLIASLWPLLTGGGLAFDPAQRAVDYPSEREKL